MYVNLFKIELICFMQICFVDYVFADKFQYLQVKFQLYTHDTVMCVFCEF